jgi:hypothetical protein
MRVAFALPGRDFTDSFLASWTFLITECILNNIEFTFSIEYSAMISEVRNKCLGANYFKGNNQVPFEGFDYDFIMFLDHDQMFTFEQFKTLLNHNLDIVSGWYPMPHMGRVWASCGNWEKEGSPLYRVDQMGSKKELIEVDFSGLGFTLIKKGVFEKLKYPWFYPTWEEIEGINKRLGYDSMDALREDIAFYNKAKRAGFAVWIDPNVRVGHDKRVIL